MPNFSQLIRHSSWTVLSSVFYVVLQAAQLLFITHYMTADNFGYLGIANAFCFLLIAMLESGVVMSIIQVKKISDYEIASILKFNLKLAVVGSLLLLMLSFPISIYYGQPEIKKIMFFMIPVIFLSAYNAVFLARLKRNLRFDILSKIEMISILFAFVIVIYLAFLGLNFMAVVFGYWTRHLIMFLGLHLNGACKLNKFESPSNLEMHLNFGKYIYGEKILTALISNVDGLIIGKIFGMTDLGVYNVFKRMIMRPLVLMYNAVEGVAFSMLSKLLDDELAYKNLYSKFVSRINWFSFLVVGLIFLNSKFILSWFPLAYAEYEFIFKVFCLLIVSVILANPLDTLLYTNGKTKRFLKWMMLYTVPLIIVLIFSANVSLELLIFNHALFYFTIYILAFWYMIKNETQIDKNIYFVSAMLPMVVIGILVYLIHLVI